MPGCHVTPRVFLAMQTMNISKLKEYPRNEIRTILPSLVRMSLLSHIQNTKSKMDLRREVLSLLVEIEVVNNIVQYLQINYCELEIELKKEQQQRMKVAFSSDQNLTCQNGLAIFFERAELARKVKAVLSQIFLIQSQINEMNVNSTLPNKYNIIKSNELFDDGIYLDEITDIICIALAELPSLFTIHEVVDTLIYVNKGSSIICAIIANFPDCYVDILSHLISNCDEETLEGKLKLETLYALIELNLTQALTIRSLCVDLMKVPSLIIKLSLKNSQDLIGFLSGLLLGNDHVLRNWFALYIKTSQKRKSDLLQNIREVLATQLQSIILKLSNKKEDDNDDITVQASALLRLYCALRGIAGIKFSDEELVLILQLITTKTSSNSSGIRFVSLGLSMLIACPSLITQNQLEQKAIEWMQWLIKEEKYFEKKIGNEGSLGELLLLIAIHFHSNQISAIAELICSNLDMKIPIRPNNTTRIKQLFIQELFSEQIVAAHAVKVPVTINLNGNIPGYLPVHCINQLLKSRSFLKHKVTIKSWIYKQICSCTTPLHPVMPTLIEAFVNSLILPGKLVSGGGSSGNIVDHLHKPLSEDEILKVFQQKNDQGDKSLNSSIYSDISKQSNLTSQVLLLYYLVLYEEVRQSNMVTIIQTNRNIKKYSVEFMSELPIKYLIQQVQLKQDQYTSLFHPMLKLLITHFPHISLVDDWIDEDKILNVKFCKKKDFNESQLLDAFENLKFNPSKLMNILVEMTKLSPTELWKFSDVLVKNFNTILTNNVPKRTQELYKKVWLSLNSVLPRRLWSMTITTILPKEFIPLTILKYSNENVLSDPLQILKCKDDIFRSPDGLSLILRILQSSLAASKIQLMRHIQEKPLFDKDGQFQNEEEREQLKTSLIASQESAAVHILLESCLSSNSELCNFGKLWALREIRGIICSYIHQAFISEPSLANIVHFQTYDNKLLKISVNGIPSMHICIDFLAEILNIPEMIKQVFTIDLTSHLALKYAIPKGLSTSKLCLNTFSTLIGLLTTDIRIEMFSFMLPSIPRFANAFPVLTDECINILMQLGKILYTQYALGRNSFSVPSLALHSSSKIKAKIAYSRYSYDLFLEVKLTFLKIVTNTINNISMY